MKHAIEKKFGIKLVIREAIVKANKSDIWKKYKMQQSKQARQINAEVDNEVVGNLRNRLVRTGQHCKFTDQFSIDSFTILCSTHTLLLEQW